VNSTASAPDVVHIAMDARSGAECYMLEVMSEVCRCLYDLVAIALILEKEIDRISLDADNDDVMHKPSQESTGDATNATCFESTDPSLPGAALKLHMQRRNTSTSADCTTYSVAVETISPTEDVLEYDGSSDHAPLLGTTSQSTQSSDQSLIVNGPIRYASMKLFSVWFPECDPTHYRAKTLKVWWKCRQTVLVNACIVSTFVFLANALGTGVFLRQHTDHRIFAGDCSTASRLNLGAHIVINVLSSMLLGASNLCMQLLSAPTRAEVDEAHRKRIWLDIGIPNLRNLRHIALQRKVVWILLAWASLPMHVFYNSAVYNMTPQNTYIWAVVSPSFLSQGSYSIDNMSLTLDSRADTLVWGLDKSKKPTQNAVGTSTNPTKYFDYFSRGIARVQHEIANNDSSYHRLSTFDCLKRYTAFERDASDIILVSTYDMLNDSANVHQNQNSLLALDDQINTWLWVDMGVALWECEVSNSFDCFAPETWLHSPQSVADWNVRGYKIDYCLAKERYLGDKCELRFELPIMISQSNDLCYNSIKSLTRSSCLCCQLGQMCMYLLHNRPIRMVRS
jgi:hypothetical protein